MNLDKCKKHCSVGRTHGEDVDDLFVVNAQLPMGLAGILKIVHGVFTHFVLESRHVATEVTFWKILEREFASQESSAKRTVKTR